MAVAGSGSVAEESAALFGAQSTHSARGVVSAGGGVGSGVTNSSDGGAACSIGGQSGWAEFCERHARAAASDFAKSCVHYINKNLPENVRTTVSHREFMVKFIDCFSDHFDSEFSRRRSYSKVSVKREWCALILLHFIVWYFDCVDWKRTDYVDCSRGVCRRLSRHGARNAQTASQTVFS